MNVKDAVSGPVRLISIAELETLLKGSYTVLRDRKPGEDIGTEIGRPAFSLRSFLMKRNISPEKLTILFIPARTPSIRTIKLRIEIENPWEDYFMIAKMHDLGYGITLFVDLYGSTNWYTENFWKEGYAIGQVGPRPQSGRKLTFPIGYDFESVTLN